MNASLLRRIVSGATKSFSAPRGRRGWDAGRGFGQVAALEERVVPSGTGAVFGSAVAIGNDVEGTNSTAFGVATDSAGNSYVTGEFSGTVDFDLAGTRAGDTDILTARGSDDVYVAKYAANGSLVWVTQMGGDLVSQYANEFGREIEVMSSGTVLVAGEFSGTAAFGSTTLTSTGDKDAFVASLSVNGVVQWARGLGNDSAVGLDVDAAGNVYTLASQWNDRIEVKKFTAAGGAVWAKTVATSAATNPGALVVDPAGNVYVAGNFEGTVDFDPGVKTKSIFAGNGQFGSAFVMSLSTKGDFRWVSPFMTRFDGVTSSYSSIGMQSLAWDPNGYVVAGGYYRGLVDMQPSSATHYLPNTMGLFVTKLTASSGALIWSKGFEKTQPGAYVYGLDVDGAGNIYAAGSFNGSLILNPGTANPAATSVGESDVYVMKLSSTGAVQWFGTYGGTGLDVGWDIALGSDGTIHMAGYFKGTSDFDPDESSIYELTTTPTKSKGYLLRLLQA